MATDTEKATAANPMGRKSNPHFYRDPMKRGKLTGQKHKAGKKHKGNPYQPGPNHKAWEDSFKAVTA